MRTLIAALLICSVSAAVAQEDRMVVVKQNDYRKPSSARKSREVRYVDNYNAFKFDPTRMVIGEINFSWETRVADRTSLEFELGPTISNLTGGRFGGTYVAPGQAERRPNMGILLSGGVRFYPLEDASVFNCLYVSPRLKYRRYNETYHDVMEVLDDQRAYTNETIFSFNVGYQQWLSENFAFDYYIGAGIGSYKGVEYTMTSVYNGSTGEWSYAWDDQKFTRARFVGVIGVKVSIGD